MAVLEINHQVHKYIGASTDTKPTAASHGTTAGSTFYAQDTGIMYITYDGTNWVEKDTVARLEAGTAVIGKVRGVTATGDETTDDTADAVKTLAVDAAGDALVAAGSQMFGEPTLSSFGNSKAKWIRGSASPLDQKGSTGWLAELYGGVQTGDDWARINIPVKEMPLTDLSFASWSYYMATNDYMGVNIVIWVHDPLNPSNRAEITQDAGEVASAVGWNKQLLGSTSHLFYYGEITGTPDTTPTPGTHYTIAQFQADSIFSTYKIYRITIEFGWGATGNTFGKASVADVFINNTPIQLKPGVVEILDKVYDDISKTIQVRPGWLFGEPTLSARNNGCANWCQGGVSPLDQKSATSWLACLYGGVQTNDDWARVNIPVNEMPIGELSSAQWTYYMSAAESFGVNMVIWVHDPLDNDNRAEITQQADIASLEKANAWNKHVLVTSTDQFYYYGEGVTGSALTLGAPNYYGLDDFQADVLFKNWTIYRITFEYGWQSGSDEFTDAWVADIKINGIVIPLKPDSSGTGRIAYRMFSVTTGDFTGTVAPKTPFRLLGMAVKASAVLDTGENFTADVDAGRGAAYDTNLVTEDLFIGSRTSLVVPFGIGYEFLPDDEIDLFQTNGSNDTVSATVTYQTVF